VYANVLRVASVLSLLAKAWVGDWARVLIEDDEVEVDHGSPG
jgi:hypothetical protein